MADMAHHSQEVLQELSETFWACASWQAGFKRDKHSAADESS